MSAIKFRKRLTKFKITIALPKKFGSKGFITVVKPDLRPGSENLVRSCNKLMHNVNLANRFRAWLSLLL